MGTQGIRTLITAALLNPLAGEGEHALGRFGQLMWQHSLYAATAAEAYAARSQDCDPYTAHLLGLMHGLGSVAVFRVLLDTYAASPGMPRDAIAISQALSTNASVTARRIAANWGLSDRTQEALEAQSSAAPSGELSPLGRALRFGRAAGALIVLCQHGELSPEAAAARLVEAGYDHTRVNRVWERLVKAYVKPGT